MSTIKIRWTVSELENVMTIFDTQKVYRSTTGADGSFVEITTGPSRVALVVGVTNYLFDDIAGDAKYYYSVSYYNSTTSTESARSKPIRGDLSGYCTIAEIRDEGLTEAEASDERVTRAITRATSIIEQVTGMWFEPRARSMRIDKRQGSDMFLSMPIIAVTSVKCDGEPVSLDDLEIYNRHLTYGMPDDRGNPKIVLKGEPRFRAGNRNKQLFTVSGVFGYTDLAPSSVPGETAEGSQIPLSYGETPEMIRYACARLVMRYAHPITSARGHEVANAARIVEEKTADQSYKLAEPGSADGSFGMTGDLEVDKILAGYQRPMSMRAV